MAIAIMYGHAKPYQQRKKSLCEKIPPSRKRPLQVIGWLRNYLQFVNNLSLRISLAGRLVSNASLVVLDAVQSAAFEERCLFLCISYVTLEEQIYSDFPKAPRFSPLFL